MLTHHLPGRFVELENRAAEACVRPQRTLDAIPAAQIDPAKSPDRPDEALVYLCERPISRKPHDCEVERVERAGVGVERSCGCTQRAQRFTELCFPDCGQSPDQQLHREDFKRNPDLVDLLDVLRRDRADRCADVRYHDHETLVLELNERLPDRGPADRQAARDLRLGETRPRTQHVGDDGFAKRHRNRPVQQVSVACR